MDSDQDLRSAVDALDHVSRSVLVSFVRESLLSLDSLGGEAGARNLLTQTATRVLGEQGFITAGSDAALHDFLQTQGEQLFALAGRIVQRYRATGGEAVATFLTRVFSAPASFPGAPTPPQSPWSSAGPGAAYADHPMPQPPATFGGPPEAPITTAGQGSGPPIQVLIIGLVAVVGIGTLMAFGGRMTFFVIPLLADARYIIRELDEPDFLRVSLRGSHSAGHDSDQLQGQPIGRRH